jgi:hypothetical protein
MNNKKKELGQFNTVKTTWMVRPVVDFLEMMRQIKSVAVDHFAGHKDLLEAVKGYFPNNRAYDIDPSLGLPINDSLVDVPTQDDELPIFNPIWLAKNVAKRMKSTQYSYFEKPENLMYDDLYKVALDRVLKKYDFALAIVPETFITADIKWMLDRAYFISILNKNPFEDTDHPACVVGFVKEVKITEVYLGSKYIGTLNAIKKQHEKFMHDKDGNFVFNDPKGTIGLKAIDGICDEDSIRFFIVKGSEYEHKQIKVSSRHITFIKGPFAGKEKKTVEKANDLLSVYLKKTGGILLSAFKGNKKNGRRRRRLDYEIARCILSKACEDD